MDHLNSRRLRFRVVSAVLVAALGTAACSGDETPDAAPPDTEPTVDITTTTREAATGDIDVPEVPGTFPVALPSLGFGIAVPQGWQASVLSPEALERLDSASLATPFFLEAARTVAETGAIFYAAGVDDEGRVAELKIDVQSNADASPEALAGLAQAVVDGGSVREPQVVDGERDDLVRVDFRVEQPSAEDGELIDAYGSQYFIADGDRVWSLIVTSEDQETQSALLLVFESSIVFDGP